MVKISANTEDFLDGIMSGENIDFGISGPEDREVMSSEDSDQ